MKAIIVDDEPQSHEALTRLIYPHNPDVRLVGNGFSVAEGVALARQHQPDLVLLDVEMPDGTGFDLLEQVGAPSFYVVFVTAFNKYAESAFRFGALDFLTKPVDAAALTEALERVRRRQNEKYTLEQLQIALETFHRAGDRKLPTRLAVSSSKGLEMITVEDILYLEAELNYTDFYFLHQGRKNKLTASLHLKVYAQHFEPYPSFMKIHRSYIVNLMLVDRYLKGDNALVMRDGTLVPVARGAKEAVEERLRNV